MSLSSKLKTLESMSHSLDSLRDFLTFDDISLEDYVYVSDFLAKLSTLHAALDLCKVQLEIVEDETGRPIGHRLYVDKPLGGRVGVTNTWLDFSYSPAKDSSGPSQGLTP